jgi:hypothetical protein
VIRDFAGDTSRARLPGIRSLRSFASRPRCINSTQKNNPPQPSRLGQPPGARSRRGGGRARRAPRPGRRAPAVSDKFTLIAPAAFNLAFSGRTPEVQRKEAGRRTAAAARGLRRAPRAPHAAQVLNRVTGELAEELIPGNVWAALKVIS